MIETATHYRNAVPLSPPPKGKFLVKNTGLVKDDKQCNVEVLTIQHGFLWRVSQLAEAVFMTLLSLVFRSSLEEIKGSWTRAITGKEVLKQFSEHQNPEMSGLIENESDFDETSDGSIQSILAFIERAEKNLESINEKELMAGLERALALSDHIQNPRQRTTLLTVVEKAAQIHIKSHAFHKAQEIRMKGAQAFPPPQSLVDLKLSLQKEHPLLGLRINHLGTSQVKNHTLAMQKQWFMGESNPRLHVEGKLCHHVRATLQSTLDLIRSQEQTFLESLPEGFCKGISITDENTTYYERKTDQNKFDPSSKFEVTLDKKTQEKSKCINLTFHGIGSVKIGNSPKDRSHYNRFVVDLDPSLPEDQAGEKLHILFSTLGLGALSSKTRKVDKQRIKILQLFRAFYPSKAYAFERSAKTYEESITSLKKRISLKVPQMKQILHQYLEKSPELMYKQEIYPGQYVWCVKGLADQVRDKGGYGLMAGINSENANQSADRIVSMLKHGALSTQDRFQVGMIIEGVSTHDDFRVGGAGSVFTRLLTTHTPSSTLSYKLSGNMQILYDLKLIERVGFVYNKDHFGTKNHEIYRSRPSVIELLSRMTKENEVCIRSRIPPECISGILVKDEVDKTVLVKKLESHGLVATHHHKHYVNGIPLDQFIYVGENFDKSFWSNKAPSHNTKNSFINFIF